MIRALEPRLVREYNDRILHWIHHLRPQILLSFKGLYVEPNTLHVARERGVILYNYYPDRMIFACGTMLEQSLPEYDCIFDTKKYWDGDAKMRIRLRHRVFLPHGYDPELHYVPELTISDGKQFGADAIFIGTYTEYKRSILSGLKRLCPTLQLQVWGNQWDRCGAPELKASIAGSAIEGRSYTKAIKAAKINLAIMGVNPGAKDETTTRTYEIPACGGFMLHERTAELTELFVEGEEVACFDSVEELAEKVEFYLAYPEERERVAAGGHRRCVPAYSYDIRMQTILDWYRQKRTGD